MSLIVNDSQHQEASYIRRAYKIAQNAVHKLKSSSSSGEELWSLSARRARGALRDNVRRVLLGAPGEYGEMKLELLAWQYGVHQVIGRVKKERGRHQARARDFLEAQHGWYAAFMHQLLDKLQKYGGAETIVFDWWQGEEETKDESGEGDEDVDDGEDENESDKAKIQQILIMLCCKTLLCLGDICRYQHDFFPELYTNKLSYRYYMQAWHIEPASGMPWNNIGSLMQNTYHGVFSVFFYRRCLQSENPYVDCYKNLKHLFDKSKRAYAAYPRQQMDSIPIGAGRNERKQAIYWLCNVFIHLNGLLRPATYCTERELNTCCRRLLDLLDLCLYFCDDVEDEEEDDDKKPGFIKRQGLKVVGPGGLTNSSLVTVFAVLIQSFDDLRNQSSNRLGAASTLFVAAADFVIQHMISGISDFEEGDKSEGGRDLDQSTVIVDDDDEKENCEPIDKSITTINRRRRNYSDSEDNLSEGSEEEIFFDESEQDDDEEDESVYSQEHESESEETPSFAGTKAISTQNANNNTNHPIIEECDDDNDEEEEEEECHAKPKLACTFMQRDNDIIESENEEEVVDEVVDDDDDDDDGEMVFEFENEKNESNDDDGEEGEAEINIAEVVAHFDKFVYMDAIKLICDWLMANGDIITAHEKSPLWTRLAHLCNMLPMNELVAERDRANISPHILKAMDQDNWMQPYSLWEDRFLYGIPIMGDVHDHIDFKEPPRFTRWDANLLRLMCVRKFMKHLAATYPQLGITLEADGVKFLAPSIETLDDDEFNIRGTFDTDEQKQELVVVVPTPDALANHLESFKKISERGDCSIIVTNITVDGLDEMKSTRKEARDTTRWLETQLAQCAGNIQSMQQSEQKSLQRLRRQDRHAWTLQHLINIGAKLQKQQRRVILLVDQVEPGHLSPSVRKALASASANNLSIQTVDDYSTRK